MVVDEKEKRLKEAMAMMGLSPVINWTAWFIRAIVMMFFSIVLMIIIFQIGEFTEYSDVAVMFVFLLLFALSTICFCFLISAFFSKASTAATAAGLLFFLCYCPYFYVSSVYESVSASDKTAMCLLSP